MKEFSHDFIFPNKNSWLTRNNEMAINITRLGNIERMDECELREGRCDEFTWQNPVQWCCNLSKQTTNKNLGDERTESTNKPQTLLRRA